MPSTSRRNTTPILLLVQGQSCLGKLSSEPFVTSLKLEKKKGGKTAFEHEIHSHNTQHIQSELPLIVQGIQGVSYQWKSIIGNLIDSLIILNSTQYFFIDL